MTSALFAVLALAVGVHAKLAPTKPRPANPFLDPFDDPFNALRYIASNTLTSVAFALYMAVGLFMTFATFKWGARYMLPMVIGAYTFSVGLGLRFGLHVHPESKGIYIAEYLFIVLSPCAFIAADYILLSRVSRYLGTGKYLLVKPERITKTFVSSDITTFLIQAVGGAIAVAANDIAHNNLGSHIFLAGLVIQLLSFSIFTTIFLTWIWRMRKREPELWASKASFTGWKLVLLAQTISCVGILIRSVYRVAELSQGFHGHLATTESIFYGLDTYPLFLAIVVYVPVWPGRIIRDADLAKTAVLDTQSESEPQRSDTQLETEKDI